MKQATFIRWASFKTCFFFFLIKGTFNSTTVSIWFNSATKINSLTNTCNTVDYKLPWKLPKLIESKPFMVVTKQLSGHTSPKIYPWSQSSIGIFFVSARNSSHCKVIYKWIHITDREGREVDSPSLLFLVVWQNGNVEMHFWLDCFFPPQQVIFTIKKMWW